MNRLRTDIMDLLPDERLPYALEVIDWLTGANTHADVMREYGLTKSQAVVYSVLKNNAGRTITHEGLYTAVYGGLGEPDIKILKVWMTQIRQKVPHKITTVNCVGYCLEKRAA